MIDKSEHRDQLSSQLITSLQCRIFTKRKIPSALIRQLATKPRATAEGVGLGIGSHDLVDPLSTQPEVVGNLAEGLSTHPSLSDLSVPCVLPVWPRTERSPLPAGEHLKTSGTITREFTLPIALTGVVHPVAKPDVLVAEVLDVGRRDSAVTLANAELIECTDVL